MKNLFLRFLAVTAVILAVSCSKEKLPVAYNVSAMGTMKAGVFTDDSGLSYTIREFGANDVEVRDIERALAVFDVLEKTGDKEYEIRLYRLTEPLCKEPVKASESVWEKDPIRIEEGWISGGYLNLCLEFTFVAKSETKHKLDLVYDDTQSADTLRFFISHDSFGESYKKGCNPLEFSRGISYATFKIDTLLPSDKESMPVKISYPWYMTDSDGQITDKTRTVTTCGTLKR